MLEQIAALAETKGYNLKAPLNMKTKPLIADADLNSTDSNHVNAKVPARPPQPSPAHQPSRPPPSVRIYS